MAEQNIMSYSAPDHLSTDEYNTSSGPTDFYLTSNKRDYTGLSGLPAINARPCTSKFYTKTDTGETGYKEEFGWKTVVKEECMRTGTSSGNRKNNPHPKESFMVWKFSQQMPESDRDPHLKERLMQEICNDKLNSTYQVDYKGLPQDTKEKACQKKYEEYLRDRTRKPEFTLDTTVRADYQRPEINLLLKGNTSRYGCNEKKAAAAFGAVPTVNDHTPLLKVLNKTSYNDEFMGLAGKNIIKPKAIPAIARYMDKASSKDKQVIQRMLNNLEALNKDGGEKSAEPEDKTVERISGWDGPSWKC